MYCSCDPLIGKDGQEIPGATIAPVPRGRILEKLNEYLDRNDTAAAERHLLYWLEEAVLGGDLRGQLMLRNELTGHYRKAGDRDRALENAEAALRLVGETGFEDTLTAAVTRINAATALSAFGEHARALPLFERARQICENGQGVQPETLGGLYNNMGLANAALERYDEALGLFEAALARMEEVPGGELERAITCLNMADALSGKLGMEAAEERVRALVERAADLLETPELPRDGYYAFVAEKCAPSFEYYGYFLEAERLRGEAKRIYEGA